MKPEIKKLLAVLDMPDSQQRLWLFTHIGKDTSDDRDLSDLAFRLRDEVCGRDSFMTGMAQVYNKCSDVFDDAVDCFLWFIVNAQPIHWIIASLIAKELEKK